MTIYNIHVLVLNPLTVRYIMSSRLISVQWTWKISVYCLFQFVNEANFAYVNNA